MIERIRGKLIVSCQAQEGELLHGVMDRFALLAERGGAGGIRTEGTDIKRIRQISSLPIIGLWKKSYPGYSPYITATVEDAEQVMDWGADIVAADATFRKRPDGNSLEKTIERVHARGKLFMADISTLEEGVEAARLGADLVGTTLAGYTENTEETSPPSGGPDWQLLEDLLQEIDKPVVLEGRIWNPAEARRGIALGAWAVVVGSAITRPQLIVERYVQEITK